MTPPKGSGNENRRQSLPAKLLMDSRIERGTSPIPFKKFDKLIDGLNQGEYMTIHNMPKAPGNPHRRLRNALILGGLGAAAGAMYKFHQPLMKLGHQAYNYAMNKFHNLYAQPTNATVPINDHDA